MTLKEWVIKKYIKHDSPEGDFAKDLKGDSRFPDKLQHEYLLVHGACYEAITVYKKLKRKYLIYIKFKEGGSIK